MENPGFLMSFVLKTAKMKLPLHDLLIVKATAPFLYAKNPLKEFVLKTNFPMGNDRI